MKSKQHYGHLREIIIFNLLTTCDELIGKSVREEHSGISDTELSEESVKDFPN